MGGEETATGSRHSLRGSLVVKRKREEGRKWSKCRNVSSRFERLQQPGMARTGVPVIFFCPAIPRGTDNSGH